MDQILRGVDNREQLEKDLNHRVHAIVVCLALRLLMIFFFISPDIRRPAALVRLQRHTASWSGAGGSVEADRGSPLPKSSRARGRTLHQRSMQLPEE